MALAAHIPQKVHNSPQFFQQPNPPTTPHYTQAVKPFGNLMAGLPHQSCQTYHASCDQSLGSDSKSLAGVEDIGPSRPSSQQNEHVGGGGRRGEAGKQQNHQRSWNGIHQSGKTWRVQEDVAGSLRDSYRNSRKTRVRG